MIISIGNEFLDFNADIEVEKRIKSFENIAKTDGDFSYDSEMPITSKNLRLLNYPFPDSASKIIYQKIECKILTDNGIPLYEGFMRIEGIRNNVIPFSFFSGNTNWFSVLDAPLSDIDFSDLDVDQSQANIEAYISANEGVVFPVVDNGVLQTRSYRHLKIEDFVAGIYVKDVFKRIFTAHGIKIQGELLKDVAYNSIITVKNGKSKEQIDANSSYVQKTSTDLRPTELTHYKMIFDNDTDFPYFDGSNNNFDLLNSRWVAPYKMRIELEAQYTFSVVDTSYSNRLYIYINGVFTFVDIGLAIGAGGLYNTGYVGTENFVKINRVISVEAGDIVEIYTEWQQSSGSTQNDVTGGYLKITPLFIYKVFGNTIVPNWTQSKYVSNILSMFNVLSYYDRYSKTITFNLFDKIKQKESIDISEHVTNVEVDYTSFISEYGKNNTLSYNEVDFDDLRTYNIENFFKYGEGSITTTNEFLPETESIVESDFSNPIGYINPVFDMSIERLNLIQYATGDDVEVTSVSDASGIARFNIADNILLVGDLVRISNSTNPNYNGDWRVDNRATGYIEVYGVPYETDATAKLTKITHEYNNSDDVYVLWHIPSYPVSSFSGNSNIRLEDTDLTTVSLAYFNLLNTDREINSDYKQSLSFGEVASSLFYQRTIVDTYWGVFKRIINDPVKLDCIINLPYNVFLAIDFLRPISIKTIDSSNTYYTNKISGYKGKEYNSIIELIKLP